MPRRDYDSDLDPPPRRRHRPPKRSESNAVLILVAAGTGLLLLLGGAAVAGYVLLRAKPAGLPGIATGSGGTDLERLAGDWECTFRDPAGRVTMHKVKQVRGTTETATWYRPDGSVFRANRVEFQLDVRGGDKLFRYFNGVVLVGPDAGQPFPSGEYAYTLDGDTWTEFDPGGPIIWTRRK
jgi:hypothetical protein